MNINETAKEIHDNNIDKGFITPGQKRNFGEVLMLVVSELGEAMEADRKGRWAKNTFIPEDIKNNLTELNFKKHYKDTVEDELADAVIRLLDTSKEYGYDLEFHIREKMNYNKTREKLHGKKY